MSYTRIASATTVTSFILFLIAHASAGEITAIVENTESFKWNGLLQATGTDLTITDAEGTRRIIVPEKTKQILFDPPPPPASVKPFDDGVLPSPWNDTVVGVLPRGGSVNVKNGSVLVETSSPDREAKFSSFYMAYRPLPEGEIHITTRISRIDTYEQETKSGIMIRTDNTPESESIFLALSHRRPASIHHTKNGALTSKIDSRKNSRPGHWLRLVRKGGRITGYISSDGEFWRELRSFPDEMGTSAMACLAGQGRKPRRRWVTVFDHVQIGTLEELGSQRILEPKIALVDGTIFHEPIQSANNSIFRLGGQNNNKVIPEITVSRIEFHHPIASKFDEFLDGRRKGVLLSNGDFFECSLTSIYTEEEGVEMTCRSSLFGSRKFDLNGAVDALVLRPASKTAPAGQPYCVLTWRGGRVFGRNLRVKEGQIVIDTVRLRTQKFPLKEISQIINTKEN